MDVDHGGWGGQVPPPEFGVEDTSANCPSDFVVFQNFKHQNAQNISI